MKQLNHCWSVDESSVYLEGRKLKHADPKTFVALNEQLARDRNKVYSMHSAAEGVRDPGSFEVLDEGCYRDSLDGICYGGYARDAHAVYFVNGPISAVRVVRGADLATFTSAKYLYGKDARAVYYEGKVLAGSTPERFEALSDLYARDARSVYYAGRRIEEADPGSFEILEEYHARDSRHVYSFGEPVPDADPQSFRLVDPGQRAQQDNGQRAESTQSLLVEEDDQDELPQLLRGASDEDDSPGFMSVVASSMRKLARPRPARARKRKPDIALLARTLARGNEAAFSIVALAIQDPKKFVEIYSAYEDFVDEPNYAALFEDGADPKQLKSFYVLEVVYFAYGLLGVIDWRAETQETVDQVDAMLRRHGIWDFDWSFIDVLDDRGDGTELRNNNFLPLLRDRLSAIGLRLAHINMLSDSYGFAVLTSEEFEKINGMSDPDTFRIGDEFDPDEGYERAKQMLATNA